MTKKLNKKGALWAPEIENTIITGDRRRNDQLDRAIQFDVYSDISLDQINDALDELFQELLGAMGAKRQLPRLKAAFKTIIVNIYVAYISGVPLRYSRSKADYANGTRCRKLFLKYSRVIPIFDTLIKLGYAEQNIGFQSLHKSRHTRVRATGKLIQLLTQAGMGEVVCSKESQQELIILNQKVDNGKSKKQKKVRVEYADTEQTVAFRRNLEKYNNFMLSHQVTLDVSGSAATSYLHLDKLCKNSRTGVVVPLYLDYRPLYPTYNDVHNDTTLRPLLTITRSLRDYRNYIKGLSEDFYRSTATELRPARCHYSVRAARMALSNLQYNTNQVITEAGGWKRAVKTKALTKKYQLADIGINRMVFDIRHQCLHRVFNNGTFEDGGRFYGAFHLGIPRKWRKEHLLINNGPTVELDYAAHHIRIAYHLEGVEYTDDPYQALGTEDERDIYKNVVLTAINADSDRETIHSVINRAEENPDIKCPLTPEYVRGLIGNFRKVHRPIAKYISSGIGITLMNIDSQITEGILMYMMRHNIPCLPVHDSYIVPVKHKDTLHQVMVEEYQKIMGGTPIITEG